MTLSDSSIVTKIVASHVTISSDGNRGLSEALLHILAIFLSELFDAYCNICGVSAAQVTAFRRIIGCQLSNKIEEWIYFEDQFF